MEKTGTACLFLEGVFRFGPFIGNREEYILSYKTLDSGIAGIYKKLIAMEAEVESQVELAVRSLLERDIDLAEEVKSRDEIVDGYMRNIEAEAVRIIATLQPVASDLRILFTTVKVVTDLERAGDNAVGIARISTNLGAEEIFFLRDEIRSMKDTCVKMMREGLDSFVRLDSEKAYEVTKLDDIIDDNYVASVRKLYAHLQQEPQFARTAAQLNFAMKYLERIGDHMTNVCEWTVYIKTGEHVELNL